MIYWNHVAKSILAKIENKIKDWELQSWFFLIAWPKNIWKKSLVKELVNKIWVLPTDILFVEDEWKKDGKNYIIKVDSDDDKQPGARQIAGFLSTTWFGDFKIVFIENIERMNISSANALLKIFEEPPKWVFIFATTSNKNKILDTILSRAILINMFPLNKEDFDEFLAQNMISLDEHKKNILFAVSWWRIWLANKLLKENDELLSKIEEYLQLEEKKSDINSRFSLLKEFIQDGSINLFLDWLIFYYSHTNQFVKVDKIIDLKIKNQANVNLENLLFDYLF